MTRDPRQDQASGHPHYRLVVRTGAGGKEVIPLSVRPVRVGRGVDCEVTLDEAPISRLHCVISLVGGRPTVIDQGSTNGTFLNGARIHHAWLDRDDAIVVGRTVLTLHALDLPATPPPGSEQVEGHRRATDPSRRPTMPPPPVPTLPSGDARERLAIVYRLGALLASASDEATAAEAVLDLVMEAIPMERAFVLMGRGPGDRSLPTVVASRRRGGDEAGSPEPSKGVIEQAVETGHGVYWLDIGEDPDLAESESLEAADARAVLCAPLLHGAEVIGLLYGDAPEGPDATFEAELALFEGIADQAALALGRARLKARLAAEHATVADQRDRLEELSQSLEWRVQQKTALASARSTELQVRLDELEQIQTARESMARALVHDIKELVSAVVAGVDFMLLGAVNGSKEAQAGDGALEAAQAIVSMAEDVLAVSRMETGSFELAMRRVAVADLFEGVARRHGGLARALGVEIVAGSPGPEAAITADPSVIGRVLDNLVGNALRYAGRDGQVSLEAKTDRGLVSLVVHDTGPGVPEEDRERIFKEWFQLGKITRGHHGIGLHFCQLAAEAHGGSIRVEGDAGDNAFVVSLPALPQRSDEETTFNDAPQHKLEEER